MSWHRTILLSLALLAGSASANFSAAQEPRAKIPPLHGTVLTGDKVNLPEGLNGRVAVLVVGFSQASRDEVTAWGKRLASDYAGSSAVVYYEMPVLESVPRLLRGWVLKKISDAVPDSAKSRFLPVMDHEAAWKKAAGFTRGDNACVLVVDRGGSVRKTLSGAPSDATYGELQRQLETLSHTP